MKVYYNEIDDDCCDWLSNLMDDGAITAGVIDNRSIEDIRPSDLEGFDRVHFFAGIGVWEYAFIQSGLDRYSGIWTGSCPCQPFSAAGKGDGFADERHLWPAFYHLIQERRPSAVLGEQVASKDGLAWLDLVSTDMEVSDYAFGAGDLCAAGFGAPHIRQRLYWSAFGVEDNKLPEASRQRQYRWKSLCQQATARPSGRSLADRLVLPRSGSGLFQEVDSCGVSDSDGQSQSGRGVSRPGEGDQEGNGSARERSSGLGTSGGLADCHDSESGKQYRSDVQRRRAQNPEQIRVGGGDCGTGPTNGFWGRADWLSCRDGKWRPVEPGTLPLAHGATARVGRLRAYGNAVVAPQAIEFCRAVREFIEAINSDI